MNEKELKERILVVDDEPNLVEFLACRLKNWGYVPLTATQGESALAIAEKERPDLVLLDVVMPDLDGREVCSRLKKNSATGRIPVILLTALGMPEQVERGIRCGADDYVLKPFAAGDLKERIRRCLELTEPKGNESTEKD